MEDKQTMGKDYVERIVIINKKQIIMSSEMTSKITFHISVMVNGKKGTKQFHFFNLMKLLRVSRNFLSAKTKFNYKNRTTSLWIID